MDAGLVSFANPHSGIVMVMMDDGDATSLLSSLRSVYALQAMPDCVVIKAKIGVQFRICDFSNA